METIEKISSLVPKHHDLRLRLTDAIIDLCRQEAFYVEELRIEGTVCVVSDRSSVLIAQIAEQIGHQATSTENCEALPQLDKAQASNQNHVTEDIGQEEVDSKCRTSEITSKSALQTKKLGTGGRYQCPFCVKSYRFKHGLKDHISLHTGRKSHVCRFCLTPFFHFGSMCGHMRREHRDQLIAGPRTSHPGKQLLGPCCPCHIDNRHWSGSIPASRFTRINRHQQKIDTAGLCTGKPRLDLLLKPVEVERLTGFTSDALENMKQELVEPEGRDAAIGDKESESILDVKNFLQQFEKDGQQQQGETGNQVGMAGQPSVSLPNEETPTASATTPDLIHALSLSQTASGQGPVNRWENTNQLNSVNAMSLHSISSVQVPQTLTGNLSTTLPVGLNGPTLEMLAHMAQLAQSPATFPAISELSQALTAQQQQQQQHPVGPRFQMPSPQSLQRSADGRFQCPFCEKTYNFKHTLKDHINKHMGNRPHVCKHCGDSFTHLASLCAHIKRRHDSQMTCDYQCELCREKFMNLQSLKQHFTWRHKDVKFSPQKFLERSRGVIQEPEDAPNTLVVSTSGTQANSSDMPQQTLAPVVSCTVQSQQVGSVPPLASQTSVSQPLNPQAISGMRTPENCLFLSESTAFLPNDHLQKKPREMQLPAKLSNQPQFPGDFVYPNITGCQENFRNPGDGTTTHARQQPDEEPLTFTTHIADHFTEVNLQTEHGLYKYKCKLCGNLFKIRNSLYEHLNSHLGKKPYVCGICGDAFTHHSSLHNHTRNKHSHQSRQEREATFRHICGACSKKFRFPSELDRHFKTNPDHDIRQVPPV